jgi:hypothetical protein
MAADPRSSDSEEGAHPRRNATLRQVAAAVFWSFFGVRKGQSMAEDTTTIRLHQLVIVGVLAGAVFVLALIALVTFITRGT